MRAKDAQEAQRVCKVALAAFGGPLGLARSLWECHHRAEPGSPTAARVLLGIANLHRVLSPPSPAHEVAIKSSWLP